MSEPFDPYYEWLGIPPKDQPPNYYRLLGIELFESSPKVIELAADRQMAHLRTFQTGQYSAESQRLLNEVAKARVSLLQPERKAEYDKRLRAQLEARRPKPVPGSTAPSAQQQLPGTAEPRASAAAGAGLTTAPLRINQTRPKSQRCVPRPLVLAGVASVLGIVLILAGMQWFADRAEGPEDPSHEQQALVVPGGGGAQDADQPQPKQPSATPPTGPSVKEPTAGTGPAPGDKPQPEDGSQPTPGDQPQQPTPTEPQQPDKPAATQTTPGQQPQAPGSVAKPAEPATAPAGKQDTTTVDMLRLVNTERHGLRGVWHLGEQGLTTDGRNFAQILMPVKPEGDYCWQVEFMRRGSGWLGLMFPVDGTTAYFEIGASGGKETGVGVIDRRRANDSGNPTRRPCEVKNNRRYTVSLSVRYSGEREVEIKIFLDGAPYIEWKGPIAVLSEDRIWSVPRKGAMAIGSTVPMEIHRSRLQVLTGQATLLDEPSKVLAAVGPPRRVDPGASTSAPPRRVDPGASTVGPPLPGVPEAQPKAEKLPMPGAESLAQAQALARELYANEIQEAKTEQDKGKLARKLVEQARQVRDDPAGRYVLLQMAQELAVDAVDFKLAMESLDWLAEQYVLPFDLWQRKTEIASKLARKAARPEDRRALVQFMLSLIAEAQQDEAFTAAEELARLATAEAARLRDKQLTEDVRAAAKDQAQAAKAFSEAKAALATLQTNPGDVAANRVVGQYYCFVRGDWEKGLPYLAKGGDPAMGAAAKADIAASQSESLDAAALLRVADAWWDLSAKAQARDRDALRLRAGYWYNQALGELESGLVRMRVEKRLEEVAKIDRPSRAVPPSQARRVITNSIGMKLVYIPAGEFVMGSPEGDRDASADEKPAHRVRITRPFYIGMYEVTQAEFQQVMGRNPSYYAPGGRGQDRVAGEDTSRHPVESVFWKDAATFCMRLSELPAEMRAKRVYRLPTEAEWEYACRAGTTTAYFFGDSADQVLEYAWTGRNARGVPRPVGTRKPNPWGLYDMYGNVGEWCADYYDRDYYKNSPLADPTGPPAGADRVMRGGDCFSADLRRYRSAARHPSSPGSTGPICGFRVVMVSAK